MPSAMMLIPVPLTTWSARSWIDTNACTRPISAPAATPARIPRNQEPVRSAPKIPKKAPVSIMPSSPMLMTPLRSDRMPPIAPKMSGVAKRSIPAVSADHTKTRSRLLSPDFTAITARIAPSTAMPTAIQPSRRSPSRVA